MKTKYLLFLAFIVLVIALHFVLGFKSQKQSPNEVSPTVKASSPSPIASPSPSYSSDAPQTFKFDSNTDLNKELDKVNPQVLNSDFQ